MLPAEPNRQIPSSLRQGDTGWPVYGLQQGLNAVRKAGLGADGNFGPMTRQAVVGFQQLQKLAADGVAGPATQSRIILLIDRATHTRWDEVPTGMMRGFSESEGGNNLGATNWSVGGGVDCGVVQIRVTGPPYARSGLFQAYDPQAAMDRLGRTFTEVVDRFRKLAHARKQKLEFTQRCAALNWNWPYAADQYARNGGLPDPGRNAEWAVIGGRRVRFPNGVEVKTWRDWAEFYALGGRNGEGSVVKYVEW